MDWNNLVADVTRILPPNHYTAGRNGGTIKGVTVHHMAGNLTIDQCYNTWSNKEASAHYAVQSDGKIGQCVNDWDTAWACGNAWANNNTVSIEHANNSSNPWTVNNTVLDQGAHLCAAICRKYGLGRPQWLVNVFPHKHWSATACPGELYGSQKDAYIQRAQYWYDQMSGTAKSGKWLKGTGSNSGRWWYKYSDGSYPKSKWLKLDAWYYFDKNGWAITGWSKIGGKWYYFASDCRMQTGWIKVEGKWYYCGSDGAMKTGWVKDKNLWYYCGPSGAMLKGWLKLGGLWYWLSTNSGVMAQNTCVKIDGAWYAFGKNGALDTSVQNNSNGSIKFK